MESDTIAIFQSLMPFESRIFYGFIEWSSIFRRCYCYCWCCCCCYCCCCCCCHIVTRVLMLLPIDIHFAIASSFFFLFIFPILSWIFFSPVLSLILILLLLWLWLLLNDEQWYSNAECNEMKSRMISYYSKKSSKYDKWSRSIATELCVVASVLFFFPSFVQVAMTSISDSNLIDSNIPYHSYYMHLR